MSKELEARQRSAEMMVDGRISGVWLFHESGWRRYSALEFHLATLEHCGLYRCEGA